MGEAGARHCGMCALDEHTRTAGQAMRPQTQTHPCTRASTLDRDIICDNSASYAGKCVHTIQARATPRAAPWNPEHRPFRPACAKPVWETLASGHLLLLATLTGWPNLLKKSVSTSGTTRTGAAAVLPVGGAATAATTVGSVGSVAASCSRRRDAA